jgi:hypothetical protein
MTLPTSHLGVAGANQFHRVERAFTEFECAEAEYQATYSQADYERLCDAWMEIEYQADNLRELIETCLEFDFDTTQATALLERCGRYLKVS